MTAVASRPHASTGIGRPAAILVNNMVFYELIDSLDTWLENYGESPIQELRSFAYGIKMDVKAVRNAIALENSNGIVEGFVNKLKEVKRVMYGRASLELLKRKMVFSNLCFN